jgi:chromosomal replication initiator protein
MVETDTIVCAVAEHYGLSREQVLGGGRWRRERRIAIYLTRHLRQHSLVQIGRDFGGLDRTNVLFAIHSIQKAVSNEPALADDINNLCDRIRQGTAS